MTASRGRPQQGTAVVLLRCRRADSLPDLDLLHANLFVVDCKRDRLEARALAGAVFTVTVVKTEPCVVTDADNAALPRHECRLRVQGRSKMGAAVDVGEDGVSVTQ